MTNSTPLSSDELLMFIRKVWSYMRSITGDGNRQTLIAAKELIPELEIIEVPTGTKIWDWTVPKEWIFRGAKVINSKGEIILDSKVSNLHVVNYSQPINKILSLEELQKNLFSLPDMPDAIPYRTSYYKESWGFCIEDKVRRTLVPGDYQVIIDSDFTDGSMTVGQIYISGKVKSEILFSTYICHPMMANNELSGPAIALGIASYIRSRNNYYSYRILFHPETIGTLYFLSKNLDYLKNNLIAGYVLTCLGDELAWNFMPSRTGNTLSDKVAKRTLEQLNIKYKINSLSDRGSDERQYCSPRVNLPVSSVMRSKYDSYSEYHTSKDDLTFISKKGLHESFEYFKHLIQQFEDNRIPVAELFGEPMLSKRNLRGTIGGSSLTSKEQLISQVLAYSDGSNDTFEIAKILNVTIREVESLIDLLCSHKLIKVV